jgi:hypothetical protein
MMVIGMACHGCHPPMGEALADSQTMVEAPETIFSEAKAMVLIQEIGPSATETVVSTIHTSGRSRDSHLENGPSILSLDSSVGTLKNEAVSFMGYLAGETSVQPG